MKEALIFMTLILVLVLSSVMSKAVAYTKTDIQQTHKIIKLAKKYAKQYHVNREHIAIVDWSRPANKHRFFLVSLKTNTIVYSWYTSHGKASGGKRFATKFSNAPGSHKSSLGAMRVAEVYYGKNGYSVRLDGLESINSNVRSRVIVIHPGDYVSKAYILIHKYAGRSLGCITLDPKKSRFVIDKLKNGGIIVSVK